jgi:LysR family nitrogen assimilation transcriptional regulator
LIDAAFVRAGLEPRVTAEIESAATLREAIEAGLGATILPHALVSTFPRGRQPVIRRVVEPSLETTVSLCVSAQQPLSEPARAVRDVLVTLVQELFDSSRGVGIHAPKV